MRWYDAADDAKARNAVLPANVEPEQFAEAMAFRPDDGSRRGRWRVVREAADADTWAVYDLRRGHEDNPQFVRVASGLSSARAGVVLAQALMGSRALRAGLCVVRHVRSAAAAVREEWGLP